MFRAFGKDISTLSNYFPNGANKSYRSLFSDEFPARFPQASQKYIKLFDEIIPQSGTTSKAFLAYCVTVWIKETNKKLDANQSLRGILKSGCLLSLA